jgi:ferredoxin
MSKNRSGASVIQSSLDIKRWQQQPPTVVEARPAHCPACGVGSCPVGGRIQLHGHGLRERQVRGPGDPEAPAVFVSVLARRYRCVPCGAVVIVVPLGVHGRRVYSASAIGLALALWGLVGATAALVRQRVCPATLLGDAAATGWATLRRWVRDIAGGRLFAGVPGPPDPTATLRRMAARTATALAARADPTTRVLPDEHRAFLGAAHVA